MIDKDKFLLEKAYLSISKPIPSVSTDKEQVVLTPQLDKTLSAEDEVMIDEPKVNFDAFSDSEDLGCGCDEECECGEECSCNEQEVDIEEETEEEDMAISNLNAIRESLMKISSFCHQGGHLHEWQLQKLAICMDNLSEVARRLK